ncbi:MAG: tRNA (adenosine(37)-N6)-threonylcarbamoyltransferase complex ATPase subunit type 1 TsaE [Bacteroidia bacterium]|nr:tRNA (adenosine(37)-N6)-threonylcarbamoyltransferase complex ATPase subunit type 1 TsaE [Bacteroidia bacterium]
MQLEIKSLEQIDKAAKKFLHFFTANIRHPSVKIFAFYGEMGAGKTTFIKALCKAAGVVDIVNSPSFSIINEYKNKTGGQVYHLDFFRIKSIEEAFDVGYEDYFYSDNYCFIEWPEKIEPLLPENTVKISIIVNTDNTRLLRLV